jgi:transcriptional regulator with XRE-family HTH domain
VNQVGGKIRELRRELNLTQSELASRIGIQQSDLSRMERGKYRVSLDALLKILGELNMTVAEFFDDTAKHPLTPRYRRLLQEFGALDAQSQREVEDFIAFKRSQSAARRREREDL